MILYCCPICGYGFSEDRWGRLKMVEYANYYRYFQRLRKFKRLFPRHHILHIAIDTIYWETDGDKSIPADVIEDLIEIRYKKLHNQMILNFLELS